MEQGKMIIGLLNVWSSWGSDFFELSDSAEAAADEMLSVVGGERKPYRVQIGVYGGIVRDLFEVEKRSQWQADVLIFDGDESVGVYDRAIAEGIYWVGNDGLDRRIN